MEYLCVMVNTTCAMCHVNDNGPGDDGDNDDGDDDEADGNKVWRVFSVHLYSLSLLIWCTMW